MAEDSGLSSSGLNLVKLVQHQQRCTSYYIGLCWHSHSPTIIDLSRSCRYQLSIHFSLFAAATCPRHLFLSLSAFIPSDLISVPFRQFFPRAMPTPASVAPTQPLLSPTLAVPPGSTPSPILTSGTDNSRQLRKARPAIDSPPPPSPKDLLTIR